MFVARTIWQELSIWWSKLLSHRREGKARDGRIDMKALSGEEPATQRKLGQSREIGQLPFRSVAGGHGQR